MQEVTRACRTCKQKPEVCLVPEHTGIQRAFNRGPDTFSMTDDECEVCGKSDALRKE
jgi:hypothetical protein